MVRPTKGDESRSVVRPVADAPGSVTHPSAALLDTAILQSADFAEWFATVSAPLPWRTLELTASAIDLTPLAPYLPFLHTLRLEVSCNELTLGALPSLERVQLRGASAENLRTVLEAELSDLLLTLGVPFVRQASFPWRAPHPMNVDVFVPAWGLIAEADGRRWHTRVSQLETDLDRDNEAAAHGIHVMRFTHAVLVHNRPRARSLLEHYRSTRLLAAA